MKAKLFLLILLSLSLFNNSFGRDGLTKEDAQKQIEQFLHRELSNAFYLNKFVADKGMPDNIAALQQAGFIDLVCSPKAEPGTVEVMLRKKALPYFEREEKNELYFSVGNIPTKVIAIEAPTGNDEGAICYVTYSNRIVHNPFLKVWNPHCFKEGTTNDRATFVKTADGWKIKDGWR